MSEENNKLILGYWAIRGLAQPIRFLLEFTKMPYEDVRYQQAEDLSRKEWTDVKFNLGLDFPNIPYLIDGDFKLTESRAILKYIARKHDLVGKNEKEKALVDMLLNVCGDFSSSITRIAYNSKYEELLVKHKNEVLPRYLNQFNDFLGDKKFIIGDLTVADFPLYELIYQSTLMVPDCLEKFPKLVDYLKRFEELEPIAEYKKSDRYMERPCNNVSATWK